MMSLLTRHLEQIQSCAESIASLPFPPPQIFTNALLAPHDITALIRDTEPHERALFSVPALPNNQEAQPFPAASAASAEILRKPSRRQTVFAVQSGEISASIAPGARAAGPRRNAAVAAVLGPDLHGEIRKTERGTERGETAGKGEVDIEVLLRGAEKLLEVHSMDGTERRIAAVRSKWRRAREGVRVYGERVERQRKELAGLNGGWDGDEGDEETPRLSGDFTVSGAVTDEDLLQEEDEIRELERKKRELEERVSGMERDLGGLLR